jgi:putative transposase
MESEDRADLPRKTRKAIEAPFHAHEFTFSTFNKRPVLLRPGIPEIVLAAFHQARHKFDFDINAYVVMPDHVHALIRPREDTYKIGPILQAIKGRASHAIFEFDPALRQTMAVDSPQRGVTRRLWEPGGGYDRNIIFAKAAWASIQYIHMNPVRKKHCREPDEWQWSSARAYKGEETFIPVDLCEWHSY